MTYKKPIEKVTDKDMLLAAGKLANAATYLLNSDLPAISNNACLLRKALDNYNRLVFEATAQRSIAEAPSDEDED